MAVTPESNLALIEELQDLVGASTYEPVDGPEFSYPAVGQAVDDEMWQWITRGIGSGIFATGGYPYWLRNNGSASQTNSTNQMRLTVDNITKDAQAIFNGFYHKLKRDILLDFPMPISRTTYYVVLELNPLKARDPEGPISVKVYPNELNTESGRKHMVLWSLTREPNQLLTDATIVRYRPRASPSFTVTDWEHLPDPTTVLYGTVAFIHGVDKDVVIAKGLDAEEGGATRWESLLDARWNTYADGSTYRWPGHGYRRALKRKGKTREIRGRAERVNGTNFSASSSAGYLLFQLGPDDRPAAEVRFITAASGVGKSQTIASVTVRGRDHPDAGEVRVWVDSDCSWVSLDGIKFDVD